MKDNKVVYIKKEPYVYELNTYNKDNAKDNLQVIEESLNDTKVSLSKYQQDVDTLYENANNDGFKNSLKSFKLLQNNLINELQVNSSMGLSNKSRAVPLKVTRNSNEMVSVEKVTKPKKNYELGNLTTQLVSHNNNRDNFHFSNKDDDSMVLTVGNMCASSGSPIDPEISVGSVIQVEGTTNYNGFFQCKAVLNKWRLGFDDGQYEFFAAGLRHKADEDHSQTTKVSVHNSATEAQMIGASTTQMKPYILGPAATTASAGDMSATNTLTLSCDTDGVIKMTSSTAHFTASGSTGGIETTSIVKIEGSQVPEYNGLFLCKTASTTTVVELYGGSTDIYKANHLASEVSAYEAPNMKYTVYNPKGTSVYTPTAIDYVLSTAETGLQGGVTATLTNLSFTNTVSGEITVTAVGGTVISAAAFPVDRVIQISSTTGYDGYFTVKTAGNGTVVILNALAGTWDTTVAAFNTSTVAILTSYPLASASTNVNVSSVTAVGVSQDLSKSFSLGTAAQMTTGTGFALAETNGIITVTSDADLDSDLAFGDVCRIAGSTNFNGYYMVVEDTTTTNRSIKLYAGDSNFNYANETTTANIDIYYYAATDLMASVSISESENNQFKLGSATVADITADDEADAFLQFQNRDDELIKMTVGMYLNSPNIAVGTIVNIKNTAQYNGMWAVKSVDTIHISGTSGVHGVYTLIAPGLENKSLEKYYTNASISMYASNVEQQDPVYHNATGTKKFSIKLSNNSKHIALYVPGMSLYVDDAGLLEIMFSQKNNNLDVVKTPEDKVTRHRLSGKFALATNLDELKEMYLQIIGDNKDLDGINANKDILKLMNNIDIISKSLSSIKNAPYLY